MSNRPKKRLVKRTAMKNISLIQNTLPVWNLPLRKKRWKNATGSENSMNMSGENSCFSAGSI